MSTFSILQYFFSKTSQQVSLEHEFFDDDQSSLWGAFPNRLSDYIHADSFRFQETAHKRLRTEQSFLEVNEQI